MQIIVIFRIEARATALVCAMCRPPDVDPLIRIGRHLLGVHVVLLYEFVASWKCNWKNPTEMVKR